jgi:hypothetical protein
MEIGDLHYLAAPARGASTPSPRHRCMAMALAAGAGALLWIGLLLASVSAD